MNLYFSYAGPEISYPVKPFTLSTESQDDFWNRCLHLSLRASDQVKYIEIYPILYTHRQNPSEELVFDSLYDMGHII